MKAILYVPGKRSEVIELEDFKNIQQACGGFVERIILDSSEGGQRFIQLWCNEDGIALRLPINLLAMGPLYEGAPIRGTAIIAAAVRANGEDRDADLTPKELERWSNAFPRYPAFSGQIP